jgi:hypothetical protein
MKATKRAASPNQKRKRKSASILVGMARYTRQQWLRLKEIAADPERLDDAYEDWLAGSDESMKMMEARGLRCVPIHVDVDELAAWCLVRDRPLNGEARAAFAAEKAQRAAAR